MGVNNSSLLSPLSSYIGRKRRSVFTHSDNAPSCKKFCPEDTIYEQCFVNGVGHDIVVKILDRKWKLHKESLIKSPYFASMFSGSWKESHKSEIEIQIPNPKITEKAINIVLGSLYHPNVSFEHEDIFSVIAAATLFQLDDLVTRCEDILLKSISCENVLVYYEVAKQYSLNKVMKGALSFLFVNLVLFYPSKPEHLSSIDSELMQHLISSPKLVTSSPLNVYRLLRLWLYLRSLTPLQLEDLVLDTPGHRTKKLTRDSPDGPSEELVDTARKYFLDKPKTQCYLCSSEGAQYSRVFHSLELFPLISSRGSIVEIQEDNIMPQAWLTRVYEKVVPIVADMMHPTVHMKQPVTVLENYAINIRENNLSKHCVKWSTVLPRDEICTPRDRSSWLTWTLHSYGLATDWKFTGSNLKVMFTPNPLFEGNLLSDNDIKYVPLYCRFTMYALGKSHQQLSCVSKSTTKLLEKFRHEDLFTFRREDFPSDERVTLYILSLQVFVVHRVILYKLMKDKLCDELSPETPCIQRQESVVVNIAPNPQPNPPAPPVDPPNEDPEDFVDPPNEEPEDYSDDDSNVDVEGEYYSDSDSDASEASIDSASYSSEDERELPEIPELPPSVNQLIDPPSPESQCSSLLGSHSEKMTGEKLASAGEERDEVDEDSLVQIVIPKNIHTATIY